MRKKSIHFWVYLGMIAYGIFLLYLTTTGIIPLSITIIVFASVLILLGSELAETLWRLINGVRPLRLNKEKERLRPLFLEVYEEASKKDRKLSKNIDLYIQEDININASAFGRRTLILTKGSTMLLNDDNIKGLIAHELGHFSNGDGKVALILYVLFLPVALLVTLFTKIKKMLDEASKESLGISVIKGFYDILYLIYIKGIGFIFVLIFMHHRRKSEYKADMFAQACGYGAELAEVLVQLYEVSFSEAGTVKEMMRGTHPHITKRIERLEKSLSSI